MRVARPMRRAGRRNEPGAIPVSRSGPTLHHRRVQPVRDRNPDGAHHPVCDARSSARQAQREAVRDGLIATIATLPTHLRGSLMCTVITKAGLERATAGHQGFR